MELQSGFHICTACKEAVKKISVFIHHFRNIDSLLNRSLLLPSPGIHTVLRHERLGTYEKLVLVKKEQKKKYASFSVSIGKGPVEWWERASSRITLRRIVGACNDMWNHRGDRFFRSV